MNILRRNVLKGAGAASAVSVAMAAGLLKPGAVFAAEWNKAVIDNKDLAGVMKAVGGAGAASGDISVKAPDIAENGAVVPVEITSNIAGTESIIIIGEKNSVFGYAGSMSFTDLAYSIMCASWGHIVALPGASENCLFIGTTAAWIGL